MTRRSVTRYRMLTTLYLSAGICKTPQHRAVLSSNAATIVTERQRSEFSPIGGPGMQTIKYFMWGYQHLFRSIANSTAGRLFAELDPALRPRVFLIGLLQGARLDRHPICVESEDSGYHPSLFADVVVIADGLETDESNRKMIVSHPIARDRYELWRKHDYLRRAIIKVIDSTEGSQDRISFCSLPSLVEDYLVFALLQIDRHCFQSIYRLDRDMIDGLHPVETSLVSAAVNEFLSECTQLLSMPEPGRSIGAFRSSGETFRAAGNRLMLTPSWAVRNPRGLFQTCATIASLKYEGQEGIGLLAITSSDHPNVEITLSLLNPVPLDAYRAVRKMLQLASNDLCLISDANQILGLGRVVGQYDHSREDLFVVAFLKHHMWELRHAGQILMRVSYGEPGLPKTVFREGKFRLDLPRVFSGISPVAIDELVALARIASEQKHGTMLVITPAAAAEAERLETQCTRIRPTKLTPDVLRMATAIDGAVVLDIDATCHAIGVILDGRASRHGNPARGARYNSAVRYVESSEVSCIALVFSEDGTIDLIPDLAPQISRSVLEETIRRFRAVATEEIVDQKSFNQLMEWLGVHRFYLTPEICEEINQLRCRAESRFPADTTTRVCYEDFVASEKLDDSYFID